MPQEITVVAVIVLLGYVILAGVKSNRPRLRELSNYALLYESAIAGGILFFMVWGALEILESNSAMDEATEITRFFTKTLAEWVPFAQSNVLIVSTTIVFVAVGIENLFVRSDSVWEKAARRTGEIPNLVLDALAESRLVQLTTVRGKVYVGWIGFGPPLSRRGEIFDIAVVPLFSGFRDKDTQKATLSQLCKCVRRVYAPVC